MSLKRQSGSVFHVSNHDKMPTWPSQQRHEARRFVKPPILPAVAICAVSKPGLATCKQTTTCLACASRRCAASPALELETGMRSFHPRPASCRSTGPTEWALRLQQQLTGGQREFPRRCMLSNYQQRV